MATTVTVSLGSACVGGGHATVTFAMTGGPDKTYTFDVDEARAALNSERLREAALVVLQLHCRGMTKVQARNEMLAGFTMVI